VVAGCGSIGPSGRQTRCPLPSGGRLREMTSDLVADAGGGAVACKGRAADSRSGADIDDSLAPPSLDARRAFPHRGRPLRLESWRRGAGARRSRGPRSCIGGGLS